MSETIEEMDTNRVVIICGYLTIASVCLVGSVLTSRFMWEMAFIGSASLCLSLATALLGDGYNRTFWRFVVGGNE